MCSTTMNAPPEQRQGEVLVPTELDILCGKSKVCVHHPGTLRYNKVVDSFVDRYAKGETKHEKMCVTKDLYDYLKTTSRFLKPKDDGTWEEISALAARDKVGHALRFAVNAATNGEKKKSKRRHRRGGSDFSLNSITSINSTQSNNTQASQSAIVSSLFEGMNIQVPLQQGQDALRSASPSQNNNGIPPLSIRSGSPSQTGHPLRSGSPNLGSTGVATTLPVELSPLGRSSPLVMPPEHQLQQQTHPLLQVASQATSAAATTDPSPTSFAVNPPPFNSVQISLDFHSGTSGATSESPALIADTSTSGTALKHHGKDFLSPLPPLPPMPKSHHRKRQTSNHRRCSSLPVTGNYNDNAAGIAPQRGSAHEQYHNDDFLFSPEMLSMIKEPIHEFDVDPNDPNAL